MSVKLTDHNTRQGIALSFLAGYVDTFGFVALFGLFPAHITGNLVLIGSQLVHASHGGVLIKLLVFPAFVSAVALARVVLIWLERSGKQPVRYLLLLQLFFLLAFMLAGYLAGPIYDDGTPLAMIAGMLGAAAMGVQNANSRLTLQHLTQTTMMTGNVTQVVIDLVDILRGAADHSVRMRCIRYLWPIISFGIGAIAGAFGFEYLHFFALLLPAAILVGLISAEYLLHKPEVTPSLL